MTSWIQIQELQPVLAGGAARWTSPIRSHCPKSPAAGTEAAWPPPEPCCPPSPCQPLQPQRGWHQVRRDHGAAAGARLAAGPVSVAPAGRRALGLAVLPSQATFQPRWERHKEFCFLPKTQGARSAWRGVCAGLLCLAQGTSSVLPSPGGQLGGSYVPCWALGSAAAELHPDAFWFWDIASLRKRADVIRAKRVEKAQVGSAL